MVEIAKALLTKVGQGHFQNIKAFQSIHSIGILYIWHKSSFGVSYLRTYKVVPASPSPT
jgi:hypothetical protein